MSKQESRAGSRAAAHQRQHAEQRAAQNGVDRGGHSQRALLSAAAVRYVQCGPDVGQLHGQPEVRTEGPALGLPSCEQGQLREDAVDGHPRRDTKDAEETTGQRCAQLARLHLDHDAWRRAGAHPTSHATLSAACSQTGAGRAPWVPPQPAPGPAASEVWPSHGAESSAETRARGREQLQSCTSLRATAESGSGSFLKAPIMPVRATTRTYTPRDHSWHMMRGGRLRLYH